MNCEKAQELFSAHFEGLIGRNQAHSLDEHLAECADCRSAYADFARVCGMLGGLEEAPVPANLTRYVSARLDTALLARTPVRQVNWLVWARNTALVGAAAAALLFGFFHLAAEGDGWLAAVFGGGSRPETGVARLVGQPTLAWNDTGPELRLQAQADGVVEIDMGYAPGEVRQLERFEVKSGQIVPMPIEFRGERALPTVLTVTSRSAAGQDVSYCVLPGRQEGPGGVVTGGPLQALEAVAARYGVAILVLSPLPDAAVSVDCSAASAEEAVRGAAGLTEYECVFTGRVLTMDLR
jgi:hypothetical protein